MKTLLLIILSLLWLSREIKTVFFYIYLWQLKEYHLLRFLDHFRTDKGKRLLFHPWKIAKILLFLALTGFFFFPETAELIDHVWLSALLLLYFGEALVFFKGIAGKTFKKPVLTLKAVFLTLLCLGFILLAILATNIAFSNNFKGFLFAILALDILSPVLISFLILMFQPLTVIWRQIVINKAKKKRGELKNLIVIGITGSYGKTSTKEFLATISSEKFMVLKTKENQNSEMGISRCILDELKPDHRVFICEMGAYDKGKIKEVAGIAQPQIGVITGVNEQHLALFGSMKNLISGEGGKELIESLPDNGTAILNEDSTLIQNSKGKIQNYNLKVKIKFCSAKQKTDFWAENITVEKDWLYFRVCERIGESADFKVNLVGRQNIENILLATACAKELGMTLPEIAKACEKIISDQGAMKLVRSPALHKADIIDSGYSANPDGAIAALEHLKLWSGKKVVIMPCLIELGPAAKEVHQRIGRKIAEVCDLGIITTKDWFEEIKTAALNAGMKPGNIIFSENSHEIFNEIKEFNSPENVILLEGRVPQGLLDHFKNKTVPAI